MIIYAILLWILIELSAPAWTYILVSIGVLMKAIQFGIEAGKSSL